VNGSVHLRLARDLTIGSVRWLWSAWPVGLPVMVLATSIFLVWPPVTEQRARWIGTALQLFGTGLALWGLDKTRRLFQLPSLISIARSWVNSRPGRNVVVEMTGQAVGMSIGLLGTASVEYAMGPHLDPERRLSAIESNLAELRKEFAAANSKHAAALSTFRTDLVAKIGTANSALADVRGQLRESQAGGLWQATAGLVFIFVGMVICGVASDIGAPIVTPPQLHALCSAPWPRGCV
jgi:hypothetical protein